jgi:hypothetical protein
MMAWLPFIARVLWHTIPAEASLAHILQGAGSMPPPRGNGMMYTSQDTSDRIMCETGEMWSRRLPDFRGNAMVVSLRELL